MANNLHDCGKLLNAMREGPPLGEELMPLHVAHHILNPAEPWSDSLTATPGQRLTVPDSLTALTALSLTV